MFSFCKKEGFEFSHSPEHAFTSGAIYCLKAEIFWASPHTLESRSNVRWRSHWWGWGSFERSDGEEALALLKSDVATSSQSLLIYSSQSWQGIGFVILIKYLFRWQTKAGGTFKNPSKPIHAYLLTLNLRATKRSTLINTGI